MARTKQIDRSLATKSSSISQVARKTSSSSLKKHNRLGDVRRETSAHQEIRMKKKFATTERGAALIEYYESTLTLPTKI
eukprot:CAMPEP_0201520692 /NCGR_PEP_ID=MMETSP0161_2-20130828/12146_1 /ASSEMBLY_ACC=CAM_ASM_000251 /TAXON_ID=180227 /ORGANISM="Neoparamoeba aestuarina, Strain SoJaBio B1-5/56/2" /LENGTH=78 /DNA_ID=CAMNT_0047919161 /DNA_START=185 /DNA_END=421 /DNA_ORIENTATION=+